MSDLRVSNLKGRTAGSAPSLPDGAVVTGICSATDFSGITNSPADFPNGITGVAATFTGNVTVGGTITYDDVTRIDSVGIVTAGGGLYVGRTEGGGTGIGITATPKGHIIAAGVVTATQYNDASGNIKGIGISSAGTTIGTGVTTLNFIGAGNTFALSGTTVNVSIAGGSGGGGGAVLDITACLFV